MKLSLDPMPAMRAGAVKTINGYFAQQATEAAPRALAHRRKVEHAAAVLAGRPVVQSFADEAEKRGLPLTDFAKLVNSKAGGTDDLDAIELRRQRALLAIDAATTPAAIEAVLKTLGDA